MRLFVALYAFCKHLFETPCEHSRVNKSGGYCPDCGYQVRILWAMIRCRRCTARRLPRRDLDGSVAPMFRYCRHCGSADFQLIKKPRIHAHEMTYAVNVKDVDYTSDNGSEHRGDPFRGVPKPANPFEAYADSRVVEGEVVGKRYVS